MGEPCVWIAKKEQQRQLSHERSINERIGSTHSRNHINRNGQKEINESDGVDAVAFLIRYILVYVFFYGPSMPRKMAIQ